MMEVGKCGETEVRKKKSDIRVPISIHKSLNLTIFCPIITLMEDILD